MKKITAVLVLVFAWTQSSFALSSADCPKRQGGTLEKPKISTHARLLPQAPAVQSQRPAPQTKQGTD